MSKMKQSVVPWRTPEQFQKVYEYLYSKDISLKSWAVEQICVWQTRSWPSLPAAVEVSQQLVSTRIQDMLYETHKSLCHAREIEMMYGMGIVRFVNMTLEKYQNTKGKIRMADLAEKHNIPSWLVDVRHDITHGLYPTLPVLRMASDSVMEYLKETFWAPESTRLSLIVREFDEKYVIDLIEKYRTVQHMSMINKVKNNASRKALKKIISKIYHKISKSEFRRKFLEILVHPDNCVTKEDVYLAVINDKEFFDDTNLNDKTILPKALQRFWSPMVEVLHKNDSVPEFLELLQLSQENRKIKVFQKVVDYLVIFIMDLRSCDAEPSYLRTLFQQKGPLIDFRRLLYSCMKGSSVYSMHVFNRITKEIRIEYWEGELSIILSIKQGLFRKKYPYSNGQSTYGRNKRDFDITFTAEDLEEDIQGEMAKRLKTEEHNHWKLTPIGRDFSKEPLGYVHNPVIKEKKEKVTHEKEREVKKEDNSNELFKANNEEAEIDMMEEESRLKNFIFQDISPAQFNMVYRKRHTI